MVYLLIFFFCFRLVYLLIYFFDLGLALPTSSKHIDLSKFYKKGEKQIQFDAKLLLIISY